MRSFAPKMKIAFALLICFILVHTVLSFCGCVQIRKVDHFHEFDQVSTAGLMTELVAIGTIARIALFFGKSAPIRWQQAQLACVFQFTQRLINV